MRFSIRLRSFFAALEHLDEWAWTVVRENLSELDFAPGQEVRLSDAGHGRIDKQQAFKRLGEHFAPRN